VIELCRRKMLTRVAQRPEDSSPAIGLLFTSGEDARVAILRIIFVVISAILFASALGLNPPPFPFWLLSGNDRPVEYFACPCVLRQSTAWKAVPLAGTYFGHIP
jgi:hypothetical protein